MMFGKALPSMRRLVGAALLSVLTSAAMASDDSHGAPKAGAHGGKKTSKQAAVESELDGLLRRYSTANLTALKEKVCLITPKCATDEGRLLDAMESSRLILRRLAEMAEAGDAEAAFHRGRLSYELADRQGDRAQVDATAEYPDMGKALRRRWAQETFDGQRFLAIAAAQGHPPGCLMLAERIAAVVPRTEPELIAHLFRCAVTGFLDNKDRANAVGAFAKMRKTIGPREALLLEAHSLIFRQTPPERPWQRVEPAEALAERKKVAP